MDDQMFRTVMRGFDKEEVFAYIQKIEADANQKVAQAREDVIEKDKQIAELKQRIQSKDARYERLENEIEVKYRTYIDNYEKIGSLVYESQVKGDQIIAEAQREAARLTAESRAQYDKTMAEADLAAKNRIDAVQNEIDTKIGDARRQYAKIQEDMNEIVDLINEAQRRFMRAYKEVHEVVQRMPVSFDDTESDASAVDAKAEAARKIAAYNKPMSAVSVENPVIDDDLDDFDSYDDTEFDTQGVRFNFNEFEIEDDEYEEAAAPAPAVAAAPKEPEGSLGIGDTIDFSKLGISSVKLNYTGSLPVELQTLDTQNLDSAMQALDMVDDDEPDYDFGKAFSDEGLINPFADEGTFRLPGEKI